LLFEIVKNYSLSGNPESINCIPFVTTPPVSLKTWTLAYQWAKLKNKTVIEGSDTEGRILYYVAAGNCMYTYHAEIGSGIHEKRWEMENF